MGRPVQRAFASVTHIFTAVTDHVSGADIVRADRRRAEQTRQRMAARIDALRKGFTAIRERHDELSGRISTLRRLRA